MNGDLVVVHALGAGALAASAVAPRGFEVTLPGGMPFDVRVQARDGWLTFDAPLYDGVPSPQALLGRNATLGGGARIVLAPAPRVRADVPLDGAADVARRVVEACAGIGRARTGAAGDAPDAVSDDLAARCRETGWPVAPREPGIVAVDLEVPDGFQQALLTARDGVTCVATTVVDAAPGSDAGREALALLLLRVAGAVRMVRPAGDARLEVGFDGSATPSELGHAFAALSVACRLTCREAAVLRDHEDIARAYLAHMKEGR